MVMGIGRQRKAKFWQKSGNRLGSLMTEEDSVQEHNQDNKLKTRRMHATIRDRVACGS
jgi:hypothetical protein